MKLIILITIMIMLMLQVAKATDGQIGPNNGGTFGTDTGPTSPQTDWTNPSNAQTSNNAYAASALGTGHTYFLKATNFGFIIPDESTITGVLVQVEGKRTGTGVVSYAVVKLIKGGSVSGDNKATGTIGVDDLVDDFGSSTDLWGLTLLESDIEASDFGTAITFDGGTSDNTANIDHIKITVYFTYPVTNLNITQPNSTNPSSVTAGDSLSVNFTFKNGTININSTMSVFNITVGGILADMISRGHFTDNPNYQEDWNNAAGNPADWATWGSEGTGIFSETGDTTRCVNDANDDCVCIDDDSDVITNINELSKQSDIDLSECENGTATLSFLKVFETGTLEPEDCMNVSLSSNGGTTYANNTNVFCDDSPASVKTIQLSNQFHTENFRAKIVTSAFGGFGEVGCLDNFNVSCDPKNICEGKKCQVNITLPSGLTGLQNLFINVSYLNNVFNDTEINAVNYAPADSCTPPAINNNWVVVDKCVKTGQKINLGTGSLTITTSGGFLILEDSNLTARNLTINNTAALNLSYTQSGFYINISGIPI